MNKYLIMLTLENSIGDVVLIGSKNTIKEHFGESREYVKGSGFGEYEQSSTLAYWFVSSLGGLVSSTGICPSFTTCYRHTKTSGGRHTNVGCNRCAHTPWFRNDWWARRQAMELSTRFGQRCLAGEQCLASSGRGPGLTMSGHSKRCSKTHIGRRKEPSRFTKSRGLV